MNKYLFIVITFLAPAVTMAQSVKPILIETKQTALLLTVGNNQRLYQSYLGKKLPPVEYEQLKGGREVYLTAGMDNQFEPAVRMIHN
ncbi:MAG: alpha-galactosidase, partial [Bacteroidetes bacterium]|nr:alpha-galactosidase [Bacteroidota bacterium]